MKVQLHILLLALGTLLGATPVHAQVNEPCKATWLNISEKHSERFLETDYEARLRFQTIENQQAGEALEVFVWRSGDKVYCDSPYFTVWMDASNHAMLMKESQTLVLRSNGADAAQNAWYDGLGMQSIIDSAMTFMSAMQCDCTGSDCDLVLRFQVRDPKNTTGLSECRISYQKRSKAIQRIVTVSYEGLKKTEQHITIAAYSTKPAKQWLNASVLSRLSVNGQLRPEFAACDFKDLRTQ